MRKPFGMFRLNKGFGGVMMRLMVRTTLRSLIILLVLGMGIILSGCTTIKFDYPAPSKFTVDKNITLAVGEFKNETGYDDPNRVGFSACLDRPVSQAVREAMIIELESDGYEIGESPYEIRGIVHSIVYGEECTKIRFVVGDKTHRKIIYDKTLNADANTMGIFDQKGHVTEVKRCITSFLEDPEFRELLPAYIKQVNTNVEGG
jgi:hypothetical protein